MISASSAKYVAIDTETNGEDIRDGRGFALGASLAWRNQQGSIESLYLPFKHRGRGNYELNRFRPVLQTILDLVPCVYHNAKFDLVSLATLGLDTSWNKFMDSMLLAHQINENEPYSKSLDACGKHYLNDPGKKMKGTELEAFIKARGWARVPAEMMHEYAAYDAHLTLRLFEVLWPMIEAENGVEQWHHKAKFVRLIKEMEANGVRIDTDLCRKMAAEGHRNMEKIQAQLDGLNPASPGDLRELLINRLGLKEVINKKTGRPTFDKNAMVYYEEILERRSDKTAQLILEYRGWQKSTSSNYEPYIDLLSPDGRLRPSYKLHGTKTGRLSCEKPNLQQIPKSGEKPWNGRMKSCFIPEDGYVLIEADYSQLELRLGAAYADQKNLIEIFSNPENDIFKKMASELGFSRQETKTLVYTIQYGGGVNRVMEVFGVSEGRAEQIIEQYYHVYPGFKRVSRAAKFRVKTTGSIKLWSGRYRHFQYPKSESYKAFNSVIQGGAADIVERTMLRCADSGLNTNECRMLLQVHDSIVFEVREDKLSTFEPQIKYTMEAVEPDFGVRFKVDVHPFGE